jgi:hypothetical protein
LWDVELWESKECRLQRLWENADVRRERLLVLTGGQEPEIEFTIQKVLAVLPHDTASLAEIAFTDLGLFIVPYVHFEREKDYETFGTFFGIGFGAFGASIDYPATLIGKGLDRLVPQMPPDSAVRERLKEFEMAASVDRDLPLPIRFARNSKSVFLPADEVEISVARNRDLAISFRDLRVQIPRSIYPEDLSVLGNWRRKATACRKAQRGSPHEAGLAALYEWAARPSDAMPEWVDTSLRKILEAQSNEWELLSVMSGAQNRQLLHRFEEVDQPSATKFVALLRGRLRRLALWYWGSRIGGPLLGITALVAFLLWAYHCW